MDVVELHRDLTGSERTELIDGEADPFELATFVLPPGIPKEHRFVLRDEGRIVASAGLLPAAVQVEERQFDVVGIGGVLVTHSRRGQGLFRRVMKPALQTAEDAGPEFALLFCLRKNAPLYAKLGFRTVADPVISTGIVISLDTMWRPLRPHAHWPAGAVTILGPMF